MHPKNSSRRCLLLVALSLPLVALAARGETLTLAQCLRETAEHNPAIIQQRYAIAGAGANALALRARALPVLGVAGIVGQLQEESVGTRSREKNATTGKVTTIITPTTDKTTLVFLGTETLYQPLFDAAIPASFRRGTAGVLAAQENLYTVASAQLHLARTLFLQALFFQQSSGILGDAAGSLDGNVRAANQLVNAGLAGQASLLSAQVQRANFDPGQLATTGAYQTDLARLLQIMGRESDARGVVLAGALGEAVPAFDPAEATRRALDRRPDLRSLRALVRAYTEDVNIDRAGYYPLVRLYVNGEAVPQSNVRNNTPNAVRASDQVNVTEIRPGADENWTIIDPGTVRGEVRNAKDQRDILAIAVARLERSIPADLAVVRARLVDAASTSAALSGSVATAQKTLDMINTGVKQGVDSQLEFLDAQSGYYAVRSNLLAASLEMSLAHAEFDRITGNYLQFVDAPPAGAAEKHSPTAKK